LRLKIECDSIEQIQLIQDALSDHQKERKKQQEIYWRQCELAVSRGVERPIPPTPTEPTIKKVGDYFRKPKPHGYRAINLKLLTTSGLVAEIQIVHKAVEAAYDATHPLYKMMDKLASQVAEQSGGVFSNDQARQYAMLVNNIAGTYDRIAEQHGLDDLLDSNGKEQVAERRAWMASLGSKLLPPDAVLPPWQRTKNPSPRNQQLSEQLTQLGFEVIINGDNTTQETATMFAQATVDARKQFTSFPDEEQNAIRSLLTGKCRTALPEVKASPSLARR
jgi:hypothetical protein